MYRSNLSYHRNWDSKTLSSRGSYVVLVNSQKAKTLPTADRLQLVCRGCIACPPPPFQWSAQDPRARKSRRCRRSNYQIVRHFTRVKREAPEAAGERGKGIRCEGESPTKKRGVLRGCRRRQDEDETVWKLGNGIRWKEKEKKIRFLKFILFFSFFNPLICVSFNCWNCWNMIEYRMFLLFLLSLSLLMHRKIWMCKSLIF